MKKHLSMRSGNPALNKNTFTNSSTSNNKTMTIDGTVNKIGRFSLLCSKRIQNLQDGQIQNYAIFMVYGFVLFLLIAIIKY